MEFVKLDAAGNDFIALDLRGHANEAWTPTPAQTAHWCDRRHGIGADGVLLMKPGGAGADFHLTFLNPDGSEAFCGNGARAAFTWWRSLSQSAFDTAHFTALDGLHEGHWVKGEPCVDLQLAELPRDTAHGAYVHSGTEHLVLGMPAEALLELNLEALARPLRYHGDFAPQGVNVNVVATSPDSDGFYAMRTFEKGVEGETLSCGSGTVAAAAVLRWSLGGEAFKFRAPGGTLGVVFADEKRAWLSGPVEMPFSGTILPS